MRSRWKASAHGPTSPAPTRARSSWQTAARSCPATPKTSRAVSPSAGEERRVRKLLIISAVTALMLPLLVRPVFTQADASIGKVSKDKQAGPLKGPVPRLPDGSVNLMDGVWTGGGPVQDLESQGGLKKGEMAAGMLPWAKALVATREETQEPHNVCLPMGVPRVTPFPYRFVQNYTHKKPTHMFILHEGNIHSFRQIFMDGRQHPKELDPTLFGHSM